MMMRPVKVAVVGAGYVGLTTAVALAYVGQCVTIVESDPDKLTALKDCRSPIYERGLAEMMRETLPRLSFESEIRTAVVEADLVLIAVGTPSQPSGQSDTSYVEEAARQVARSLRPGQTCTLAIKSTVSPGTSFRVARIVECELEARGLAKDVTVRIASTPEFLREGAALQDVLYPDRIVIGANDPAAVNALRSLYRPILEQTFEPPAHLPRPDAYNSPPLVITNPTSAELIKYAANAFLATKISFINEIAGLCAKSGADVAEVALGLGLDPRIGPRFLEAGLGWGGSCFPKDIAALLATGLEQGHELLIVEAARKANLRQRHRAVDMLHAALQGVRGRVIGVLGLAFKPGTDDVREAPALEIIRILLERGAFVRAHDPVAMDNARNALGGSDVSFFDNPYALAADADALALATEWPEYGQLDLLGIARSMRTPVLLDGRNMFAREKCEQAGFTYLGLGR